MGNDMGAVQEVNRGGRQKNGKAARWLLVVAILGFSFIAAYWSGTAARKWREASQSAKVTVTVTGLSVAAQDLDLGEVWEEKGFSWRLPIRNETKHVVTIKKFVVSCGCTGIEPQSLTIPPGETATVSLTINLLNRHPGEYGMDRRALEILLQPVTAEGFPGRAGWKMRGTIQSRVTLNTQAVHFGDQPIHGQTPVSRRVLATVHVPCQRLEVAANPLVIRANVNRVEGRDSQFEILLSPNPAMPPGKFQTSAEIKVVTPAGDVLLAFELPVEGTMQRGIRVLPERVLMEPKPVGESTEAIVTLQAIPGMSVVVDHVETDSPGLQVESVEIEGLPAKSAYRIRQRVTKEGEQTASVRFVVRKEGKKLVTLPAEVNFRGDARKWPKLDGAGREER